MKSIALVVGERIQAYRRNIGLTQADLAEKAELHTAYVGQIERGERNATLKSIEKISRALNVPFEVLFEAIVTGDNDNAVAKEAYNLITSMPEKEQQTLLEIIKKAVEYKNI